MSEITINKDELQYFTGSENWTRWTRLKPNAGLTDGALYVAKAGGAYWLMDIIASVQDLEGIKGEYFQNWQLQVKPDRSALVTCDDGNGNVLYKQVIEYTDFPLDKIQLYAVDDSINLTIMLPGEY